VVKSSSDIIFLSDTRLNSHKQIAGVNDIEKKLKFLGYNIFHNSVINSRGTAILVSTSLEYVVEDIFRDADCNILLMRIRARGTTVTIGSVYGPNNDNKGFFDQLKENIMKLGSDYAVIGGDWNTTYDCRQGKNNLDILNTATIPSHRRSLWLQQLCTACNLTDHFRHFFPDSKEYTYVPYAAAATNRSRLDFFLVSETVLDQCVNCRIPHSLSSLLFDHKQVFLQFKRFNPYKKQMIDDKILKDEDLSVIVTLTAIECYINHLAPSDTISDIELIIYG
jgi:exonuclease III